MSGVWLCFYFYNTIRRSLREPRRKRKETVSKGKRKKATQVTENETKSTASWGPLPAVPAVCLGFVHQANRSTQLEDFSLETPTPDCFVPSEAQAGSPEVCSALALITAWLLMRQ